MSAPTTTPQAPSASKARRPWPMIAAGIVIVLVAGYLIGGPAGLLGGKSKSADPLADAKWEIIKLDSVNLNLADEDHYLKLGISLEKAVEGKEHSDFTGESTKALDEAIGLFDDLTYAELKNPQKADEVRAELSKRIRAAYVNKNGHETVRRVYYHEFLTQ